jgi:hypothetical protein
MEQGWPSICPESELHDAALFVQPSPLPHTKHTSMSFTSSNISIPPSGSCRWSGYNHCSLHQVFDQWMNEWMNELINEWMSWHYLHLNIRIWPAILSLIFAFWYFKYLRLMMRSCPDKFIINWKYSKLKCTKTTRYSLAAQRLVECPLILLMIRG